MFLTVKDLKKSFGSASNKVEVLKGINFEVNKGEICVLLGPSGSGKSTLLNIIGGIDDADSGYVSINNEKTKDMKAKYMNWPYSFFSPFRQISSFSVRIPNLPSK